ncbi:MAG: hypothetical protein ABI969_00250 [bacterium]
MQRLHLVAFVLFGSTATSACGQNLGGPEINRPVVKVDARDFNTGQQASSIKVGGTTSLMLVVYSPTDSLPDPDATWISRNASIASNAGSTVTGRAVGTTYVVGELTDAGNTYRDSVQVTVTP